MKSSTLRKTTVYFFLGLILIRPFIDIYWWVKDYNIWFSPLYWLGVLPLPLILFYLYIQRQTLPQLTSTARLFIIWSTMLLINSVAIVIIVKNLQSLGYSIKIISPVLFFFFIYSFINDKTLDLIIKIFLVASIFPLLMVLYEIIAGPINAYIPGGREYLRYRGLYADGIDYTIHWTVALLCAGYLFLRAKENVKNYFALLLFVSGLLAISLIYLHQAVAYLIFGFLFILLLYFAFKKNKNYFLGLILTLTIIFIILYIPNIEGKISSLFHLDSEIIKGNADLTSGANGRVGIWLEGIKDFFSLPFYSILFGSILSGETYYRFLGAGAHSDYIRILFVSGIAGIIVYIVFLIKNLVISYNFESAYKFIGIGTIGVIILFSVSHTPTFYLPFVYFASTILAFISKSSLNEAARSKS